MLTCIPPHTWLCCQLSPPACSVALFITVIILTSLCKDWGQAEGHMVYVSFLWQPLHQWIPSGSSDSTGNCLWSPLKTMVFLVVMYGCQSWTIKKAERRRIDTFGPWCWRRLLRVPWAARRSIQSILKEINPEYSLEGLMLKLQTFGCLI